MDVPVEIDGVCFRPGDLVIADEDGIVVVPQQVETVVVRRAWEKVYAENRSAMPSARHESDRRLPPLRSSMAACGLTPLKNIEDFRYYPRAKPQRHTRHANTSLTTFPATSVNRKSRPPKR